MLRAWRSAVNAAAAANEPRQPSAQSCMPAPALSMRSRLVWWASELVRERRWGAVGVVGTSSVLAGAMPTGGLEVAFSVAAAAAVWDGAPTAPAPAAVALGGACSALSACSMAGACRR